MSPTNLDAPLFDRLNEIASGTSLASTMERLPEEQRYTAFLFFCALACKSEEEYVLLREGLDEGKSISDDFAERLALVSRAFCVGHDWVVNNWSLWKQ